MFLHDADGNLTNGGRWTFKWDAENRLTNMVSFTSAPVSSKRTLDFTYDFQGRRIQKVVATNNGSIYVTQYTRKFIYDGWNLIAELDGSNNLLHSYVWGTDLIGSMEGAGGVGGLLSMTVHSGATAGTYFYSFDGNGNVVVLVNATTGEIAARYEYGPFGELNKTATIAGVRPTFQINTGSRLASQAPRVRCPGRDIRFAKRGHATNLPCRDGEECSLIIPNGSTPGPPTSRAVQVNQRRFYSGLFHRKTSSEPS